MSLYFLILDAPTFHEEIHPALAASWRQRSFSPCRSICAKRLATARDFAARHYITDEPLLARIADDLPFDRSLWQHLAGELLWFSAVQIPELPNNAPALARLLGHEASDARQTPRPKLPPILQAHYGSQDVRFGGYYRPEFAGLNDVADVSRLAAELHAIHPQHWQPDDLACMPDLPVEERQEELAFLRDWFGPLQQLYSQAAANGQIIVSEILE